jgi:ribosomal protein S18 acetylase RimI-like enzyme
LPAVKPTIERRPVEPDDDTFLAEVYAGTRADEMATVPWDEAGKKEFLDLQYRAQTHSYTTRFPDSEHSVVLVDGERAGRIWTDEWEDEIRLLDIAFLPQFRNRGVGTVLLTGLQDDARASGKVLRHSVEINNEAAIRFYERLGFTIVPDQEFATHFLMEWIPS